MKRIPLFVMLACVLPALKLSAQCSTGTVYGVSSNQQSLYSINATTGATTLAVNNLYGGGTAGSAAMQQTSAIALDIANNILWFCNRGNATDPVPHIYSYNLGTNTYGTTVANFAGVTTNQNLNKAAYNPADGKIYFHNSTSNILYVFNPATPTTAATAVGTLSVPPSFTTTGNFAGGDIAFDGLGNMTGAFNSANILAVFPGQYNAAGNYLGLTTTPGTGTVLNGQQFTTLGSAPASVCFLADGNYLVGGTTFIQHINTNTGAATSISTTFASSDFTSCASPSPQLVVKKTASRSCNNNTITYTITVQNTGQFHALNTRLIDTLPAGVTLTSATLNGTAIAGVSNSALSAGIQIKSPTAATAGQVFKGETATIILNCSAPGSGGPYSNQAFVKYNGVEALNLPNDQVPSDDPGTAAVNDRTVASGCFSISGSIFNDNNGGVPNGTLPPAGMVVNILDGSGNVVATTTVNASGNYTVSGLDAGIYSVQINTTAGIQGQAAPNQVLPTGYQNVGSTDSVTPKNGSTPVTIGTASVTGVNFGINQPPASGNNSTSGQIAGSPATVPNILSNDADPNSGTLSSDSISLIAPIGATGITTDAQGDITGFTVPGEGSWSLNSSTGAVTFTPQAGFTGDPTPITYTVTDLAGLTSNPATISIDYNVPLPVALLDFTLRTVNCGVVLEWQSGAEIGCKEFHVGAGTDGLRFDQVAVITAKGSGNIYICNHQNTKEGMNYFRLKTVDLNNHAEYSRILSTEIGCPGTGAVKVFPTMTDGLVAVENVQEGTVIAAFDAAGRQILLKNAKEHREYLDLNHCPAGMYHIVIVAPGREKVNYKVIKR